jgi:transposase
LPLARPAARFSALGHPVYDHWRSWKKRGICQEAVLVLNTRWREVSLGRSRRAARHAILERQSVKTAAEGEARGFHGGKKLKGRSRHVAVDSQGTLLAVRVTAANQSDSAQAGAVMAQAAESYPGLESFTADQGCRPPSRARGPRGTRPGFAPQRQTEKKGFALIAFRWRVERTLAWLGQCRLLAKDYEKSVASAERLGFGAPCCACSCVG